MNVPQILGSVEMSTIGFVSVAVMDVVDVFAHLLKSHKHPTPRISALRAMYRRFVVWDYVSNTA